MSTPMITPTTSDTSVTFSLAELAKIEEARVREEDLKRTRDRETAARERREAEARVRAEQAAQAAVEAEAHARRAREEAEERLRVEARERAAIEVARIEAEARVRLAADNAARAQELAIIRARTEGRHRRLVYGLAAALGLVLCGGAASGYGASQHIAGLEQDLAQNREGQQALAREREQAKATDLAILDRRYAALRARAVARDAAEARAAVEAARNAVDTRAPDHDRLRALADAIDALQARLDGLEKIAALDQRSADLSAWAADRRRSDLMAAARSAAARAKAACPDEGALHAYEAALDQARSSLAQPVATGGRPPVPQGGQTRGPDCRPGEPGCDLDGHRIF